MSLRDKLIKLNNQTNSTRFSDECIADAILALIDSEPTGLVRVKECDFPRCHHGKMLRVDQGGYVECPICHGTGFIRTPMTQKEVVKAAYDFVAETHEHYPKDLIILPSGERVEVEG